MAEKHVQLYIGSGGGPHAGAIEIFNRWEYTDNDGKAVFHPPKLPPWGWITVTGIDPDACSPYLYKPEEVMATGVSRYHCPHRPAKKFALRPQPGEIIVYVAEYSRLERALYLPWNY